MFNTFNTFTIAPEDPASPAALALLEELSAVLEALTGSSGKASFDADDVRAGGVFAVARAADGALAGCGALRRLDAGTAELKRMYARPGHAGAGSALLAFLEARAAALGYRAVWLETRLVNRRAVRFYEARAYRRIPNYGKYAGNPLALCFEKRLDAPA